MYPQYNNNMKIKIRINKKNQTNTAGGHSTDTWLVFLKTVKIMKNQRWRHCHRQDELGR
jgi:hypothetical protein